MGGCGLLDFVRSENKEDRLYVNSYLIHCITDPRILLLSYELSRSEFINLPTALDSPVSSLDKTLFLFCRGKYKSFLSRQSNVAEAEEKFRSIRVDHNTMS